MATLKLFFFQRVREHTLLRSITSMMALTLVGQGIYVLAGPFIGRLYSPEEVGIFGLFVTIAGVLGIFSCGLYDLAIPAAQTDSEARALSGTCSVIGLALALTAGLGLAVATSFAGLGVSALPSWAGALMAIAIITQTMVQITQAWAIRANNVIEIGKSHVLMNAIRSFLQVFTGLFCPSWWCLAATEIFARIVQSARMWNVRMGGSGFQFKLAAIRLMIRTHKRFPLIFGPAYSLDAANTLIQTGMIGALFGPKEMGYYFIMRRTLDLPVAFAFRSLSDVFFSHQLSLAREAPERLRPFFIKTALLLAVGGLVAGAPLLICGPYLFEIFYGPEWGMSGQLAAIMLVPMALNLAVAPIARVFQISHFAQLRLVPSIVFLIGSLLLFWIASSYGLSLLNTVVGLAIVTTVHYIVYFFSGLLAAQKVKV